MSDLDDILTDEPAPSATSNASGLSPSTREPVPLQPRTRWAAIVWGIVFGALALGGLALVSDGTRFADVVAWSADLQLATVIGYGLLVVGSLALILGAVGLLRRAQVTLARRRAGEREVAQELPTVAERE
ncbi:hypothetical protein [Microbacterium sp. TNHR37B]|uniref:hypothetical protein n=1 Tax=Microbacterium sp. TNHR37B TaxID=1775956 RepID=UPI0007B1B119|nr:hypothetical protein [Microbacterium sp. TNHR37B]KZE89221.1 hypothetical protein AVP41_02013 [Microbacterium sp. TNHR37B]